MRQTILRLLVPVGLLIGCGTEPRSDLLPGAYVLETVEGSALPVVLQDDAEVGRWVLHADTIFILGAGRAERRRVVQVTGNDYMADTLMNDRRETNYRLTNGILEVGYFSCPPNALCTAIPAGSLLPDGFTLDVGLLGGPPSGMFRRAD